MRGVTSFEPHCPLSDIELVKLFSAFSTMRRLALGVSGGGDSLCLMWALHRWTQLVENAPKLFVFTVDHGLRAEAVKEAEGVAALCADWDLYHETLHWIGKKSPSNLQAQARAARFQLLLSRAHELNCDALALAHHLDDQAETFLTRLSRGSGVYGLAAIRSRRLDTIIPVERPLLTTPKSRLIASLREHGIEWFDDPSNENEAFTRIKARKLLPELTKVGLTAERIAETARSMERAANALDEWVERAFKSQGKVHPLGVVRLNLCVFEDLPCEVVLRLLARSIRFVSGAEYTARLSSLEGSYQSILEGRKSTTVSDTVLFQHGSSLYLFREFGRKGIAPIELNGSETGIWDNRFEYKTKNDAEGAVLRPLGEGGFKHFSFEPPENWPKAVFLTAPLIVFPDGGSYMPTMRKTEPADEEGGNHHETAVQLRLLRDKL